MFDLAGLAGRVKSRAVKVGDGIDARLGSVLFELNFSRPPSSRFLRYRWSPILFIYHGEQLLCLFLMFFFCSVFEKSSNKNSLCPYLPCVVLCAN